MAETIISPTTDAATADFTCRAKDRDLLKLVANGLAGSETVGLQVETAAGTYVTLKKDGDDLECNVDTNFIVVDVPGNYRANKSATVSSVGVYILP